MSLLKDVALLRLVFSDLLWFTDICINKSFHKISPIIVFLSWELGYLQRGKHLAYSYAKFLACLHVKPWWASFNRSFIPVAQCKRFFTTHVTLFSRIVFLSVWTIAIWKKLYIYPVLEYEVDNGEDYTLLEELSSRPLCPSIICVHLPQLAWENVITWAQLLEVCTVCWNEIILKWMPFNIAQLLILLNISS